MPSLYALMGVPSTGFDPEHQYFTSWLLPPFALAVWRLLFALFGWADLFAVFGYDAIHDPAAVGPQFSYFTDLTWWGITCYMTIASAHTFVYAARGHAWLDKWWRPLQALHSLYYTTIVTYPFLVTIVYWAILYNGPWFPTAIGAFTNISRHGLNSLAALTEIILPATNPPPWLHVVLLILILALYLALAYVTYATQDFYPYAFLDPNYGGGRLAGFIIGIAAACAVIFLFVWFLIWGRRRLTGTGKQNKNDRDTLRYVSASRDVEMTTK